MTDDRRAPVRRRFAAAAGGAGLLMAIAALWWWGIRTPALAGPVRAGFRDSPPFYFVEPGGAAGGLAVDVLNEAARRAGIPLSWVLIGERSGDALREGRIDLWPTYPLASAAPPIMATDPWLESGYFLLFRHDRGFSGPADLKGRPVAFIAGALGSSLVARAVPGAALVPIAASIDRVRAVCDGTVDAALLEGREGQLTLFDRPLACSGVELRFVVVEGVTLHYGIGATPRAARVAARLRDEIDSMAADSSLAAIHARWSLTTADEMHLVYALHQARLNARLSTVGTAALAAALLGALWGIRRNRQARRQAEAHARHEQQYRVLFERNLAGVYRSDVSGRILDCNDAFARMLGCQSREDLLTREAWDFYPDRRSREIAMQRLRLEGVLKNHELVLQRADGRPAILLENVTLIDAGDAASATMEGTVIDITREHDLEEQYRQAQKLESVGRLAGGVAHDFNNTLTAMNGYAELIMARLETDDPNREMLAEILKAGQHAEALTRQLLAFSRRQRLHLKVLNLNDALADVRDLLTRAIGEDIQLVTNLAPDLANVNADPSQIQQVIMNLAVNARDAMARGGRLTITTANVLVSEAAAAAEPGALAGPCVRLSVADTGEGMDEETKRRVFEPFFTTKERGKGTGLGLSTVYGIVMQSGGHIRLRSAPGEGAVFEIDLRAVTAAVSPELPASAPARLTGTETILVVEDQPEVLGLVVEALTTFGYRVLAADGGRAAHEICRAEEGPIHLLLTDVVMPELSGPAVAKACEALHPGIRVMYMSGYTDGALKASLEADEQIAYIQKPFTPSLLAARIRALLDEPRPPRT